jgi:beta-agarase
MELHNRLFMKTFNIKIVVLLFTTTIALAQDWSKIPVPADPGLNKKWVILENLSDDFNYKGKKSKAFTKKWSDQYHNNWTGPGLTNWTTENSEVADGNLIIKVSRNASNRVFCGVVTGKEKVKFPVYVEARLKVMNQTISSNFWFLSTNDRQELDVIETYGSDREDHKTESRHMNSNYHIFDRSPEKGIYGNHNWQRDHFLPTNAPLRENYHRVAAHWIDEWHIDWYLDGVLVRRIAPNTEDEIKDPLNNKGMNEEMVMIIDVEDHDWRSEKGIIATDEDLLDENKNKMFVDWVRVYKPVDK